MIKMFLAAMVFVGAMLTGIDPGTTDSLMLGVAPAAAQALPPQYAAPLGLHRSCARKIRAAYKAPGCTRRCYPRNFYRQRMDYCVQSGGSI
jgi:hypothetical protein